MTWWLPPQQKNRRRNWLLISLPDWKATLIIFSSLQGVPTVWRERWHQSGGMSSFFPDRWLVDGAFRAGLDFGWTYNTFVHSLVSDRQQKGAGKNTNNTEDAYKSLSHIYSQLLIFLKPKCFQRVKMLCCWLWFVRTRPGLQPQMVRALHVSSTRI